VESGISPCSIEPAAAALYLPVRTVQVPGTDTVTPPRRYWYGTK
jgi:hypothetical protein